MKLGMTAFVAVLAPLGLLLPSARAGDGEGKGGTGEGGKPPVCKEGGKGECKEGGKGECEEGKKECGGEGCGACAEGAREGKACCAEKTAVRSDLETVALAAVEGASEAAKKVMAAVPADAAAKVEEARKAAFERLAEIQKEVLVLQKDFETQCAAAKAKGEEVHCDLKATYEKDVKALQAKSVEQIQAFGKTLRDAIGEEKVKALGEECRKVGDMAKAASAKVKAAAAKLLEKVKAAEEKAAKEEEEAAKEKDGEGMK